MILELNKNKLTTRLTSMKAGFYIGAIVLSCGCQMGGNDAEKKDAIPAKELSISPFLGQAYNAESKNILNLKCVSALEASQSESHYVESTLKYKMDMTQEEIADSLAGSLGIEVKFPLVKAKAGANYAAESGVTEASRALTLEYEIRGPNRKVNLDSLALSPIGKKYASEKTGELQTLCGDSFVSEVTQGAKLLITMKFDFFNKSKKEEIGGFLDIDFSNVAWKANLEGNLKSLSKSEQKRISFSVVGLQIGGDVLGLAKILPSNIASCSAADYEPCLNAMAKAVDYANTDFVKGVTTSSMSAMMYLTRKYSESGLDELIPPKGYPIVTETVKVMQSEMNARYAEALGHQKRASTIITQFASYLPNSLLDEIKAIKTKSMKNANELVRGGVFCYENPNQKCLSQGETILSQLEQYDPKKLSLDTDELLNFARCEKARKFALLKTLITREEYDYYKPAEWSPDFVNPDEPGKGVAGWTPCLSVVNSYGSYFDSMYE